jgi:hypothetical protein
MFESRVNVNGNTNITDDDTVNEGQASVSSLQVASRESQPR